MIKKNQIKCIEIGIEIEIQRNLTISAFLHFANNCLLWKRRTIFDFIPTKCRMKWTRDTMYQASNEQNTNLYVAINCRTFDWLFNERNCWKKKDENEMKWTSRVSWTFENETKRMKKEMKIELRNTTSIRNNYIKIILNSSRSYQIDVSMAHFQHRIDFVLLLCIIQVDSTLQAEVYFFLLHISTYTGCLWVITWYFSRIQRIWWIPPFWGV